MGLGIECQQLLTIVDKLYISFVWFPTFVLFLKMKDRKVGHKITEKEREWNRGNS